ncbi:unnamed protein product [Caenorhabditis bovis]|uniref:Cyclin N-terminal domain-containing protein n=1 Tax=Caenorhabditis bovis TaxID=2654633 RepID=A0A8S1F1C5_9PELO|nr:unnamed protein product [Caenorhabditis bovis]
MVRSKSDYHILVAQNFLSNIRVGGDNSDTNRLFGGKKFSIAQKSKSSMDFKNSDECSQQIMKPNESAISIGTIGSLMSRQSPKPNDSSDNFTPKKPSIFKRIAKIVNNEEVLMEMTPTSSKTPILDHFTEELEWRAESPSSNQFGFLRRLKSTITHNDRYYICSDVTRVPLAVFSYLPSGSDYVDPFSPGLFGPLPNRMRNKRAKSIFGSSDRVRNHFGTGSIEELRPFVFKDPEDHISLSQMRRKRNPSPFFTLFEKPSAILAKRDRRESSQRVDFIDEPPTTGEIPDIPQIVRENCERGTSLDYDENDAEVIEEYDPKVFDELIIGKRTIIRLNGFIGSTIHYEAPERAKSVMNENFVEKHPHIHLTLSKLKSLKREMLELAIQHNIDYLTLAIAYAYFEKVVTKGQISKNNRKCVAGVSVLVAMKINDYSKSAIKAYIDRASEQLREPKEEILSYELPLCSALRFRLLLSIEELQPHLDRLQFEIY